ncbi:hypothetical protein [Lewinella sp. IMCC34191]|uniref:hypothetical protein n=1 Tax=Lewinella sp. IMCC34191 TaxID=2259172 RepID=UPI0013001B78|nr:hypothetical protein [Lewinella sp. IMCC34191]
MLRLLLPILVLLSPLSCSQSTAGLTIPAKQMFVLGEDMDAGYSATLTNRGKQAVRLQIVRKSDLEVVKSLMLAPRSTKSVAIARQELVQMINSGEREADLLVVMNKSVKGMRTQPLKGEAAMTAAPVDGYLLPADDPVFELSPNNRFRTELEVGECFLVGEGSRQDYTADVKAKGGPLQLHVLKSVNSNFVRGFGLGSGSTETVSVDEGEVLYLCNDGRTAIRVVVSLSREVPGARVVTPSR